MQVHNFFTGDGELVNSCERAKKIVDEMFSPEERGEGLGGLKMFLACAPPVSWKTRFGGKQQFLLFA